jgi:hypothetical protein
MVCEQWQGSIPSMDKGMAILLLVLNIFFPGLGTLICAFMGGGDVITDQIIVAILQWLTAICIVGWIWAIWWGILMYQKAK